MQQYRRVTNMKTLMELHNDWVNACNVYNSAIDWVDMAYSSGKQQTLECAQHHASNMLKEVKRSLQALEDHRKTMHTVPYTNCFKIVNRHI